MPNRGSNFTYGHFDLWMADTVQAGTLGWITDGALLDQLRILQGQAHEAAIAEDGFTALARLSSIVDLIQASTPAQRTDEGYALIYYNALFLSNAALYPCEPIFTLEPGSATHHLGETHTATATLTNRVDGLRIENNAMTITVIEGVNMWLFDTGVTDANGQFSFSYTSELLGEDTLQADTIGFLQGGVKKAGVRSPPAAASRTGVKFPRRTRGKGRGPNATSNCNISGISSAKVKVLWQDGPDLLVSLFIPPMLKSAPGKTFYVTEATENRGKVAAASTVTRYYLSLTEPVDPNTDRVVGQREIPALAPAVKSEVREIPFTVPSDLPVGTYHLTACADSDNQVIETDEANNCAQDLLENRMGGMVEISDNQPPVAHDQSVTVNQNSSLAITLTASDADNDPLTYTVIAPPERGTLSGAAPALIYTPFPNYYSPGVGYFGPDLFRFVANDGKADSNIGTVSIRVNGVPNANDQSVLVQEGIAKAITLSAVDPDHDPLTYAIVTPPAHGALSGTAPTVSYTPAAGYFGLDHFTFKANDGFADSKVARSPSGSMRRRRQKCESAKMRRLITS